MVQVSGFVFAAGAFRGFEKGCFPAFLPGGLAAAVLAGFLGILGGMSAVWMGENGWKWGPAAAGVHRNDPRGIEKCDESAGGGKDEMRREG